MTHQNNEIYESAPSKPDDDLWLEQGRKLLDQSISSLHQAARAFITGLGLLNTVYVGILGFTDLVTVTMPLRQKIAFVLPFAFWLLALYLCLQVMMTTRLSINLHCPEDIRRNCEILFEDKQARLDWAFWLLTGGLGAAILLLVFRLPL
ncbi:MAG: hypothetical protein ACYTBJ_10260 [Planctomycetota bacterium]|jgi:hypothetical protein